MQKTFAFIPARSGSKGVPGKNIKPLAGLPLIAHTLKIALESAIDYVVVSTDSNKIFEVCQQYVDEHFFGKRDKLIYHHRPEKLSGDSNLIQEAAADFYAKTDLKSLGTIVILQPTSPIRALEDVNALVDMLQSGKAKSAVSVCDPVQHPREMIKKGVDGNEFILSEKFGEQRQQYEKIYFINGSIYAYSIYDYLNNPGVIYSDTFLYEMSQMKSIDIDTLVDFALVEIIIKNMDSIKAELLDD
jgi:CMP-N,N'-diacetyllegionaminic acid synthase